MKHINIFLSYCQKNSDVANEIYHYFKSNPYIRIHKDILDIRVWGSIKQYMQSISDMDYIILLVTDEYLKSANCMYEVLEVLRDRKYKDFIFPAVVNSEIYNPIVRAKYVKYWENQFKELSETLKEISAQNLGKLTEDLKLCQDIASNIAEFLDVVSDMNNPGIEDVSLRIEERLQNIGLLENKQMESDNDLFVTLGLQKKTYNSEPTDLEFNRFIKYSFGHVMKLLYELCVQYQKEDPSIQVQFEKIDGRTMIYQFYKNGNLVRGLKLFLSNLLGSRENIGVADAAMSFGGNNSWNGIYSARFADGELKLYAIMPSMNGKKAMTIQDVVADIWKNYIQIYLEK